MTAPRRWKDTHDAPVGVRELLSAARPPRAMSPRAFDRGAGRVAKLVAAPAVVGVATGLSAKLAAAAMIGLASVGAVVVAKHVIGADTEHAAQHVAPKASAVAAASTRGGVAPGEATATALPAPTALPALPAPTALPAPLPAVDDVPVSAPPPAMAPAGADPTTTTPVHPARRVVPAAPPRVTVAASPIAPPAASTAVEAAPAASGGLSAELGMLEEARAALARDPSTSLAKVAQHRARHPSGVLAAERDLIELDALRRVGRTAEARQRAEAWLAREPYGLHASRVKAILASLDPPRSE